MFHASVDYDRQVVFGVAGARLCFVFVRCSVITQAAKGAGFVLFCRVGTAFRYIRGGLYKPLEKFPPWFIQFQQVAIRIRVSYCCSIFFRGGPFAFEDGLNTHEGMQAGFYILAVHG